VAWMVLLVGPGAVVLMPGAKMALMLLLLVTAAEWAEINPTASACAPELPCANLLAAVPGLHNLYRSASLAATGVVMRGDDIVSLDLVGGSCGPEDCLLLLLLLAVSRSVVLRVWRVLALPAAIAGNANASACLVDL